MTATDIYEHPEYYNADYSFPEEEWRPLDRKRFSRYKQSNCFRVKNCDINHIMKPCGLGNSKVFTFKLRNDDGVVCTISTKEIFDNFNVRTAHDINGCSEYIYAAF